MNKESMAKLNKDLIPANTRGILMLCKFSDNPLNIEVTKILYYDNRINALRAYANIPNPESQLVIRERNESYDDMIKNLGKLKEQMKTEKWLNTLNSLL